MTSMMRIGLVTAEYPPDVGGVGDHTHRLASELVRHGHTVQVVTSARQRSSQRSSPDSRIPTPSSVLPEVLRVIPRWDWRILLSLPQLARRRGWDVLHIQYQSGAYALRPAINLLPTWMGYLRQTPPVITTFHDRRVPYLFPKAGRLRQFAVRQLAMASAGIIAVTEEDYDQLLAWIGRRPRPMEHIPLGNQLDAPPPPDFDRAVWRARMGIPPGAALAGHFGFINRSKGVDELVGAVGRLAGQGRDLYLLMIGDPLGSSDATNRSYLEEVRRLIAVLGLESRVRWTGFAPPGVLSGWLRCLDVAVLPFRDGASLRRTSLIAAWAHGVPVVTTTPAEPESWLGPTPAAVAVPAADAGHLAAALLELLDDPARRVALQAAGTAYAARFSWPQVIERTVALYQAVLHARRRTTG